MAKSKRQTSTLDPQWFKDYIRNWEPRIQWTDEEIDSLSKLLMAICELKGGVVYYDQQIPDKLVQDYCLEVVSNCLDALARDYSRHLKTEGVTPVYATDSSSFEAVLSFLEPMTYVPKLDLNSASQQALVALPGIGRVTAQRIVEYRQNVEPFLTVEDVKKVSGINNTALKKFAHAVYVQPNTDQPQISSTIIEEFLKNPSFKNYVQVLKEHQLTYSKYSYPSTVAGNTKETIIHEIKELKKHVDLNSGYNPYGDLPGIMASEILARDTNEQLATEVERLSIEENMHGTLIDDSKYPQFMLELLKSATSSIRIIMFFMRFEDERNYPTDALFEALVKAKENYLDIKIILDRDAEGSSIQSRIINEEAFKYLQKKGIPVVFDSVDKYTHTKLVVVDEEHVVLGSHNWTAGSFFAYDDTSVYINSQTLAAHYKNQFESLWEAYQ